MQSELSKLNFDFLIVGAGIMGLALALKLKSRKPDSKILIIDKESEAAQHASGRNSGVLHAGFYYTADSLKARFCIAGNRELRSYCQEKNIPLNQCGKLVVASSESELPQLLELHKRGIANGAGVQLIDQKEATELEPGVKTFEKALYSPNTATSDPKLVATAIKKDLIEQGVKFSFNTSYLGHSSNGFLSNLGMIEANCLINCAGLYADKIAKDFGFGSKYTIVPFKGLYLKYAKNKTDVKMNIYPVPNLKFPFLGVHFTKTVDGTIKIGPTAIPAFWRENYSGLSNFNFIEFAQICSKEAQLFLNNSFHFRDLAFEEMRKYNRAYFISLAQKLVPTIDPRGFGDYSAPGIRAQLLNNQTNELLQDFIVEGDQRSVHLLNAVSPGWTCSFPFTEYIIQKFLRL